MDYPNLHVVDHPLARRHLTLLRDKRTGPTEFRSHCERLTLLVAMEAAREHLAETEIDVQTPMASTNGHEIRGAQVAVPILRAGLGMLDAVVELFPDVSVGYIGLERDEATAAAATYYSKLPPQVAGGVTFLLDPMLATGGSADLACSLLKRQGAGRVVMLSIIAAPEGVSAMLAAHPDVPIYTAGLDQGLNEKKYIVPGLGDFGDRLYGT